MIVYYLLGNFGKFKLYLDLYVLFIYDLLVLNRLALQYNHCIIIIYTLYCIYFTITTSIYDNLYV
jgi:hypothetical protein